MANNVVFNMTICIMGALIMLIHIVNILIKKDRRKDQNALLVFVAFTGFHFLVYLVYTIMKMYYTSDAFIKFFYTTFYIFNNIEVVLLVIYTLNYIYLPKKARSRIATFSTLLFLVFIILDIINIFTGIFFTARDGEYLRSKTMIISQGYQFIMFVIIFFVTVFNKKLNLREKVAFSIYCTLPLVAILLQNAFKGYAIAYASIIISVEVLFFFVDVEKNIELQKEEEKNKEIQIKMMLSQIQPHFIYNSLSSISTLITIDPQKAQSALDGFADYLRRNLSSITETRLIPFENELNHIKTYLLLEKIRFNNRINIVYDIKTTDFDVPPLTIQPIVENAIKHGILKKLEGGTVTIKTYEDDFSNVIEIIDDGVGFDMNDVDFTKNEHFGINNIKYRIDKSAHGTIDIESEINKGTRVTVKFSK